MAARDTETLGMWQGRPVMSVIERGSRKAWWCAVHVARRHCHCRRLCLNSKLLAVKLAMSTEMHDNML